MRALHALGHELSAIVVTWPVIVATTSPACGEALVFDRLRPVRPAQPAGSSPGQSA
ncbi:MAG: hypothetical protein MUC74_16180 [Ideonella sp.]|jgi:hypothetical protein|nr:hypothetical protein [Ideonella sp.]